MAIVVLAGGTATGHAFDEDLQRLSARTTGRLDALGDEA
jgi:hypothetical protein